MNRLTIRERLEGIAREDISLQKQNGGECNGVPAYFLNDGEEGVAIIICNQISQAVEAGDVLVRSFLPHGGSEHLLVREPGLTRATSKGQPTGFPEHYVIRFLHAAHIQNQNTPSVTNTYHLLGVNSRVNIGSLDRSTNCTE